MPEGEGEEWGVEDGGFEDDGLEDDGLEDCGFEDGFEGDEEDDEVVVEEGFSGLGWMA